MTTARPPHRPRPDPRARRRPDLRAVGVADRPARRPHPAPRPVPARRHRPPGQDAARHRRHRDHPLHRARGPGRRPDVRHRHHPGRGHPPRPRRLGVEYEPRWARLAAANIAHARRQGAAGTAEVIRGDARQLPGLLPPGTAGRAALVVTSPPYGRSVHGQVRAEQRAAGGGVRKYDNRYSHDPANLAHHGLDDLLAGFTADPRRLHGAAAPRRDRPWSPPGPGGSTASWSTCPAPSSPPAPAPGLIPADRCVALLAGLRGEQLIPRPSFFQLDNLRKARARGEPWHLIVHEDVLIFRAPGNSWVCANPRVLGSASPVMSCWLGSPALPAPPLR